MRIMVAFSGLLPSARGSNVLVNQFCSALADRGHDVHLCCFRRALPGNAAAIPNAHYTIHAVPPVRLFPRHRSQPHPGRFVSDIKLASLVRQTVNDVKPDLIHAHHFEAFAAAWPSAKQYRAPIVLHAHSLFEEELPVSIPWNRMETVMRACGGAIDRFCVTRADGVVAVCDTLAEALWPWLPSGIPLEIIPPGIPEEEVDLSPSLGQCATPLIVYVGNTDRYQNLPLLFEAFQSVWRREADARLRLVCSEIRSSVYENIIHFGLEPAVETLITQDHHTIRRQLHEAWMAVSPRITQTGFPIKIIDAMAAGCPVVACEGSAKGIIHGETGWIVPNGRPEAMAQAMIQLIRDSTQRQSLADRARQWVLQNLTWTRLVPRIEALWGSVLERYTG